MRSRASDSRLWIGPSRTEGRPRDGSSNLPGAIPLFLAHNSRVWRKSVPVLPEFSMLGHSLTIEAGFPVHPADLPPHGPRPPPPRPLPPPPPLVFGPLKKNHAPGQGGPPKHNHPPLAPPPPP